MASSRLEIVATHTTQRRKHHDHHLVHLTGTSSGLGRLLTEHLLARGDRVAATLRRPEALDDLHAEHGDRLWTAQLDVTDTERVRRVVNEAFKALGTIDVVVNNAGYGLLASVEEASDEQIRRVIDTNLLGSIHIIRAAPRTCAPKAEAASWARPPTARRRSRTR